MSEMGLAEADHYWMTRALELARRAESLGEVPVGAVLVRAGQSIGEGWNQPISGCDPTAHAEIMALRQAAAAVQNYRLPDTTLYVTIEPCTMCAGAIIHSRVARVVFAAREPKAGAVVSSAQLFDQPQMNHRVSYQGGVCEAAAAELIRTFFRRRREQDRQQRAANSQQGEGPAGASE